jgi:tRNA threonylcarbamoyladenosine biosynthesis protein TsaB
LPGDLLTLLSDHGLRPSDVDLFAVAAGPGSLTGLRVGIATIQGLAFATGRPVAAISALDALAEHVRGLLSQDLRDVVIGAWTNALRGEIFTALFAPRVATGPAEDGWTPISGPAVATPDASAADWQRVFGSRTLVVAGDVEEASRGMLLDVFGPRVRFHPRPLLAPVIAAMAIRRAARGEVSSPHAVRPLYVRRPDAVVARERAQQTEALRP